MVTRGCGQCGAVFTPAALPAHLQPWEMTRYQAHDQWLAGNSVGRVFHQAASFLNLAASRAALSALTGLR